MRTWLSTSISATRADSIWSSWKTACSNHTADRQADDADATVTLTRDTLNDIILQQTKLTDAVSSGDVSIEGDQAKLEDLVSYLDSFEFWFNIATP